MSKKQFVHPYIPNSEPRVKREMLDAIGMDSVEGIYKEIPDRLRYKKRMDLPEPIISEYSLQRHVEKLLAKNRNSRDNICFLGRRNHHGTGRIPDLLRGRRLYRPR